MRNRLADAIAPACSNCSAAPPRLAPGAITTVVLRASGPDPPHIWMTVNSPITIASATTNPRQPIRFT